MNKILTFMLWIIIAIAIFCTTTKLQAQGACDPEQPNGCTWSDWVYRTINVEWNIPGLAPCGSLPLEYRYRVCGNSYQIEVVDITDISNCPYIFDYLNLLLLGTPAEQQLSGNLMNQAFMQFSKDATMDLFMNVIFPANPFSSRCSNPPPNCESVSGPITLSTIYSKCRDFVETAPLISTQESNCSPKLYMTQCESMYCCITKRTICIDGTDGTVRICETVEEKGGPGANLCSGNSSFTPPNGCRIVIRTGCRAFDCQP